jgi:pyruvate,water dikinase
MSRFMLRASEAVLSPSVGGKARALARAELAGLPVPSWFVVSSDAWAASLAEHGGHVDAPAGARTAGGAPVALAVAPAIAVELDEAVRAIAADGTLLAVRSSASDEDGAAHSFAGQLESYLNVPPADVAARVADVWQSGFTERVLAYRRERNLPGPPAPPAVVVQRMVVPRAAGVAFGADPVTGRRGHAIVSAVPGLGSAIVSGEADADTWSVDRRGAIVSRQVAAKRRMHVADPSAPGGIRAADVPEPLAECPSLSDEEVLAVARLARASGRHFGRPQDIEWAIGDRLYLLQSRPITSLTTRPDPDRLRLPRWQL